MKVLALTKIQELVAQKNYSATELYVQMVRRMEDPPVPGTVANWFAGRSRIPADALPVIADVLGVEPADFFVDLES